MANFQKYPETFIIYEILLTRMHSSRMRTVRSSSRLLLGGGVSVPGESALGGCIPACTEADTPL